MLRLSLSKGGTFFFFFFYFISIFLNPVWAQFYIGCFYGCLCQLQIGTCHPWALAVYLYKDYIMCAAGDLQCPLKGVQSGEQKCSLLFRVGGVGTRRAGLQVVRYSQELILWAQFLNLLRSRKALKSFMVTAVSRDEQRPHDTSRHLLKNKRAWLHVLPPSPKSHRNWPSPATSLE